MGHILMFEQNIEFIQFFDDTLVGFQDKLPFKALDIIGKTTAVPYGRVGFQPVSQPCNMVVRTMAGRCVNTSCSSLKGDMVPKDENRVSVVHGMGAFSVFKVSRSKVTEDSVFCDI